MALENLIEELQRRPNDIGKIQTEINNLAKKWHTELEPGRVQRRRNYTRYGDIIDREGISEKVRKHILNIVDDEERSLLKDFFISMTIIFNAGAKYKHDLRHMLSSLENISYPSRKTVDIQLLARQLDATKKNLESLEDFYIDHFELVSKRFAAVESHFA